MLFLQTMFNIAIYTYEVLIIVTTALGMYTINDYQDLTRFWQLLFCLRRLLGKLYRIGKLNRNMIQRLLFLLPICRYENMQ